MRARKNRKLIDDNGSVTAKLKVYERPLLEQVEAAKLRTISMEWLVKCFNATRSFCDMAGKVHSEPDWKTILGAVQLALAYTDGKPIERREVITKHFDSLEDYSERMKKSPALRKAMGELLKETEAEEKKA